MRADMTKLHWRQPRNTSAPQSRIELHRRRLASRLPGPERCWARILEPLKSSRESVGGGCFLKVDDVKKNIGAAFDLICITSSTVTFVQSLKLNTSDGDMKALERVSPPSALVSAFDVPVRLATSDTSGANLKAAQELARCRLQGVGHLAFSCDVHTPHARLDNSARCFCTPRTKLCWMRSRSCASHAWLSGA